MNNFLTNSYSYCDTLVDNVTDSSNSEENWILTLCICDNLTKDPGQSKAFLRAIMRKWFSPDPRVVLKSLDLLETIICNCGFTFRFEVASAEFESEFLRFLHENRDLTLRKRFLQALEIWAKGLFSLSQDSRLSRIPLLLEKIKRSLGIISSQNNLGFGQITNEITNQNVGQQFVSPFSYQTKTNLDYGINSPNSLIKRQNSIYPTLAPFYPNEIEENFKRNATQIPMQPVNLDPISNFGNMAAKSLNPFISDNQSHRNSVSIPENDKYLKFLPDSVEKIGSDLPKFANTNANGNVNENVNVNGIQVEKFHKPISEPEFEFPPPPSWILENGHSNIENEDILKNLPENGEISKDLKDSSTYNKRKSISPNPSSSSSISESFNEELNNALKNGIGKLKPRQSFNDFKSSKMTNSNGVSEVAKETKDDMKNSNQQINGTNISLRKPIGTSIPRPNPKSPNPNRNSSPVKLFPENSNENRKINGLTNDIIVSTNPLKKKFEQQLKNALQIPDQKLHIKPEISKIEKSVNTAKINTGIKDKSPNMIPSQKSPAFKPDLPKRPVPVPKPEKTGKRPVIPPRLPKNEKKVPEYISSSNNLNLENPTTNIVQNSPKNYDILPPPPPPPPILPNFDDLIEKKPSKASKEQNQKKVLINGDSGRADLLKDIQKGIPLRKVGDSDKSKSTKSCKLASALERQLATIKAATHSDSDSDSTEEKYDNDEEWNENETNC